MFLTISDIAHDFSSLLFWRRKEKNLGHLNQLQHDSGREDASTRDHGHQSKIGVRIRGLTKVFKRGHKVAVNSLSLDFKIGEVTALLGHNGAGKSTTM